MSDPTTWTRDELLHGFKVRDEQLTEARRRAWSAEDALRSVLEAHAETCRDERGECCSACAIGWSVLCNSTRAPASPPEETPT